MQINDASGNGIICDFIAIVDQNEKQVETRHIGAVIMMFCFSDLVRSYRPPIGFAAAEEKREPI